MDKLVANYRALQQEWKKTPKNTKKLSELLVNLKTSLINSSFLPVGEVDSIADELIIAQEVLEIGAQFSILQKDIAAFERYMSQLKCYYYDYRQLLGESKEKYKLLGLNLLYLLSKNRVAEFHTELELISVEIIKNNKYISYPLALEQYIMEGRYNKIFAAKNNAPSEIYHFFMDILIDTVLFEIARCIEKSYETISIIEAGKRLNLKNQSDVINFGKKRGWILTPEGYYKFNVESSKQFDCLPSVELAEQSISYARELEMIV